MQAAGYRTIPLQARDGSIRAETLVDADDYASVAQHRWYLQDGYAVRNVWRRSPRRCVRLRLHRVLLDLNDPAIHADHINGNRLDNRRANLRAVAPGANAQNQTALRKDNRSGYRGVGLHKGRWRARVRVHGQLHELGSFTSAEQAAEAAAAYRAAHLPFSTT